MKHHKAAKPIFPFPEHRHVGEVLADEAINRRALEKAREAARWRRNRWAKRQEIAV